MKKILVIFILFIFTDILFAENQINNYSINRTLMGYSAKTLGNCNWQFSPFHTLIILNYFNTKEYDFGHARATSFLLNLNVGLFERVDLHLSIINNGFKINFLKFDKFLYSSGVYAYFLMGTSREFNFPQHFQYKLDNKSNLNMTISGLIYKKWNSKSKQCENTFGFDYFYLDFNRYIASHFQYIIFSGIEPKKVLQQSDLINNLYYYTGIGMRGIWKHLKIQIGIDFINLGFFSGIWTDF